MGSLCSSAKGSTPSTNDLKHESQSGAQPTSQSNSASQITLYYFDGFSGRADAPMLLLEDIGVQYSMSSNFRGILRDKPTCFAVPVLGDSGMFLSQTAAIMLHLGKKFGICGPEGRLVDVMRQALNCEDAFAEGYKKRSIQWARESGRFPKWLFAIQAPLLEQGSGPFLFGPDPTFADYHTLNAVRCFEFMFPQTLKDLLSLPDFASLSQWRATMEARPGIVTYLKRKIPVGYGGMQACDKGAGGGLTSNVQQPSPKQQISLNGLVLYYYDGFSGRADAAMLLLEDVGAEYSMSSDFKGLLQDNPACFAVPVLGDTGAFISQTAAILLHLGQKFGVCGPAGKLSEVMRQALNSEDAFAEGYKALNFGKDRNGGLQWARESGRLVQWLLTFQALLQEQGGGPFLFGADPTFADYHMLNTLRQFDFMYPKTIREFLDSRELTALKEWKAAMEMRRGIAAYLSSSRNRPMLYNSVCDIA